jgi:hypothetical protein
MLLQSARWSIHSRSKQNKTTTTTTTTKILENEFLSVFRREKKLRAD